MGSGWLWLLVRWTSCKATTWSGRPALGSRIRTSLACIVQSFGGRTLSVFLVVSPLSPRVDTMEALSPRKPSPNCAGAASPSFNLPCGIRVSFESSDKLIRSISMAASTPSTTDAQPAQHPSMVESAPLRETPAQQRDAAQRWLILGAHTRELIRSQSFDLDAPQRRRLETEKELEQLAEEEEDLNQKLRKVQQRSRAAHNTLHNTLGTSRLLHRAQEVIEEQEQALDHAKAVAMALHDGDNELAINRLRDVLIASGDCQRKTTSMLSELVKQGLPTSRTHFLKVRINEEHHLPSRCSEHITSSLALLRTHLPSRCSEHIFPRTVPNTYTASCGRLQRVNHCGRRRPKRTRAAR